jgi:glutamate-5-semialdehyde dehydrogenase
MQMLMQAKNALFAVPKLTEEIKNRAIHKMADCIEKRSEVILEANRRDMDAAKDRLSASMLDRLRLDEKRIKQMTDGMRQVAKLPDPVGRVLSCDTRPNGLKITKITVPLGVVAIIYESRPNVTSDAAVLCFKSSNVCVLRSGSDCYMTAKAIVDAMREGLFLCGLPEDLINLVPYSSRQSAADLMTANGFVDVLIPRGGKGLIQSCLKNATVPCIETGTGICHIYVEKTADQDTALDIIDNAKTSRPSVCNAAEVCLVDLAIAAEFLPKLKKRLVDDRVAEGLVPVELRLDPEAAHFTEGKAAGEDDFDTEFLDYILAVKIVDGVKEAAAHIALHSTGHSEAIITQDPAAADYFLKNVDSAAVYHNASTRFTDGFEFGFGAEIGISTQKMHARGPMGLKELTSYKYKVYGTGQIR